MAEIEANILHVEDNEDFLEFVQTTFSDFANIDQATTLQSARDALANKKYDLIILDFTLPDGSGSELVAELEANDPNLPIVVFSSHEITDAMNNVKRAFMKTRFVHDEFSQTIRDLCA